MTNNIKKLAVAGLACVALVAPHSRLPTADTAADTLPHPRRRTTVRPNLIPHRLRLHCIITAVITEAITADGSGPVPQPWADPSAVSSELAGKKQKELLRVFQTLETRAAIALSNT